MIHKIVKNITCKDGQACSQLIVTELEEKTGLILHAIRKDSSINGHVSISHENHNHTIWIIIYETNGIHLSESNGKQVKAINNRVIATGYQTDNNKLKQLIT